MTRIFRFTIDFKILDRPLIVTAWSGSLLLKIVYDVFHRIGIDFEKRESKPFIVEPLKLDGKYLITGAYVKHRGEFRQTKNTYLVIEPGRKIESVVYMLSDDLTSKFVEALVMDYIVKLPATLLAIDSVSIEEVELPNISTNNALDIDKARISVHVCVDFCSPTCFMLHGNDILYPSPVRLVYNIAKKYSELTGRNLKSICDQIHKVMDIHRIVRLYRVYIDIGEGRKVPTFMGRVVYAVAGNPEIVSQILQLLKIGEILGVGISRSLGFGRIRVRDITTR